MLSTAQKIRVARIAHWILRATLWRRLPGEGTLTVRRGGLNWRLDPGEGIDLTLFLFGAFEPSTHRALHREVRPGATVLDIGANIGAHTLFLAHWVGDAGRVVAFEPTDFGVEKIRRNLALNPGLDRRVSIRQRYLADAIDQPAPAAVAASWPVDERPAEDPVMGSRRMTASRAGAARLDDELTELGLGRVDLVKLDIDGNELKALRGGQRLFREDRPVFVMELAPYAFPNRGDFDEMVELFAAERYRFWTLDRRRALPAGARALRESIPEQGSMNVLALPVIDGLDRSRPEPASETEDIVRVA
jgi:FkbM family methyltransferase